jgi:hypothetical protein
MDYEDQDDVGAPSRTQEGQAQQERPLQVAFAKEKNAQILAQEGLRAVHQHHHQIRAQGSLEFPSQKLRDDQERRKERLIHFRLLLTKRG